MIQMWKRSIYINSENNDLKIKVTTKKNDAVFIEIRIINYLLDINQ